MASFLNAWGWLGLVLVALLCDRAKLYAVQKFAGATRRGPMPSNPLKSSRYAQELMKEMPPSPLRSRLELLDWISTGCWFGVIVLIFLPQLEKLFR